MLTILFTNPRCVVGQTTIATITLFYLCVARPWVQLPNELGTSLLADAMLLFNLAQLIARD